ncbi:phage minor capsid protein [Nocardiopsis sp. CT-R113]|uniref:Phage minor capsid protein n=1 Tax=Nocardiopsis codii TaxID=3065942 RepID=A0ABU7KGA2_9ACTN|nr:phage minor capsid protein [Nocardiopsis sp. CT-R113]MEE2041269.1 phage minor capsid protein [Nocardiopsis sp. CT-R113]
MPGVDPDDIDDIVAQVAAIYREGELALVAQITRHLNRYPGAPTASAGEMRLDALGDLRRSVEVIQAGLQADGSRAIREGLAAAWRLGARSALSDIPDQWFPASGIGSRAEAARVEVPQTGAIEALATAIVRDVGQVTSNILRDSLDAYRSAVAGGTARMLAAGQTRRHASQAAWSALVQRGITGFTDRAARRWRLHSYVEMAVRTASTRAAVTGQDDRLAALGVNLVYISAHTQECPLCSPWEGRVLHRVSGAAGTVRVEHATRDGVMVEVDVAGSVMHARGAGLWHPNCRHSMSAYLPGVTRLPEATPAPAQYEARMHQRHLERRIRQAKEVEAAAFTTEAKQVARRTVRARQAALREHLAQHRYLKRLRYREQLGAGSTPPRGQEPDAVDPIGPDVQPTLDGTGGVQVRRTRTAQDDEPARDQADEQVEGQLDFDQAAEEAERERAEAEQRAAEEAERARRRTASDTTRERINAVYESLPASAEAWEAVLPVERYRDVDDLIRRAQDLYWSEITRFAQRTEEMEEEFRRKRTPHARRGDLLAEATGPHARRARQAVEQKAEWERIRDQYDQVDPADIPDDLRPVLEWRTRTTYPTDSRGTRMPPPELLGHLSDVLDVGEHLLGDAERVMAEDTELAELRARFDQAGADQKAEARRAVARRESDIIRTVLASVVDLGGHEQRLGDVDATVPDSAEDQIRAAEAFYPTRWLQLADAAGPLDLVQSDRQYFRAGRDGARDVMAMDDRGYHYTGALASDAHETTVHEQGHRMEQHVPGLTYLEFALVRRASTGADGDLEPWQRLRDITGNAGYRENEIATPDDWGNPYAGKTYEGRDITAPARQSWELFQTGVQDVWGRGHIQYTNRDGVRLVLGALATLQRSERVELLDPPLESLSDDQLGERLMAAFTDGDMDQAATLEAEVERRAEAERAAAEAAERRREAARLRREAREQAQYAEIVRLVEEDGWSWEEAAAEVLGRTVEQIRRQEYVRVHRVGDDDRRPFREIAREQYRLYVHRQVVSAEHATNGYLLTAEGQRRGIDPETLFSGPRARAERWASEELRQWWDQHGRLTFEDFVAEIESGRGGDPTQDYNR